MMYERRHIRGSKYRLVEVVWLYGLLKETNYDNDYGFMIPP